MKHLITLISICTLFIITCLSSSAQIIINENFDGDDPFLVQNAVAVTGFNVAQAACGNPRYYIATNLNMCPSFPNLAAQPLGGSCMVTNEGNNPPNNRILYWQPNLVLPAGHYSISFNSAHRYTQMEHQWPTTLSILAGGVPVLVALPDINNQITIPFGPAWANNGLNFILNAPQTGFSIDIISPNVSRDFAIDNLILEQLCAPTVDDIYPNSQCIDTEINICGTHCGNSENVILSFRQDNMEVAQVVVPVNADGTYCYSESNILNLLALNLDRGQSYDVFPGIAYPNGIVWGEEYRHGQNNDFIIAEQTTGAVIINDNPNLESYEIESFCEGQPIYFHGQAEQSDRFHMAIRSRPIGDDGDFTNGQGQHFPENFDLASGNLLDNVNFDFPAGFEYQISVGISDPDECIAWTPVNNTFFVIDCCELSPAEIQLASDCANDGDIITVGIRFGEPISDATIDQIVSTQADFEYVSHNVLEVFGRYLLLIKFKANGCSCTGQALQIDIHFTGCAEMLAIETDPITCCESNCEGIQNTFRRITEPCVIVNGNLAHGFMMIFKLADGVILEDVIPSSSNGACETSLSGLEWGQPDASTLFMRGFVELTDPDCILGDVTFNIQTNKGCCEMVVPFRFPTCQENVSNCIDKGSPEIQVVREKRGGGYAVDISIPTTAVGNEISVSDNKTGQSITYTTGNIECSPFQFPEGTDPYGVPCVGISIPVDINCDYDVSEPTRKNGAVSNNCYDITIKIGDCIYKLIGDYCEEFMIKPVGPGGVGDGTRRDMIAPESSSKPSFDELIVYPNPIHKRGTLMIQQKKMITGIQLFTIRGQLIIEQDNLNSNSIELPIENVKHGMYILKVQSGKEESTIKRVSIIE